MTLQQLTNWIEYKQELLALELNRAEIYTRAGKYDKVGKCIKICIRLKDQIMEMEELFLENHKL